MAALKIQSVNSVVAASNIRTISSDWSILAHFIDSLLNSREFKIELPYKACLSVVEKSSQLANLALYRLSASRVSTSSRLELVTVNRIL